MSHSPAYRQNERKRYGKGLRERSKQYSNRKNSEKGLCVYSLCKVVVKLQCKEQCMTIKPFFRTTLQLFLIIIFINRRQKLLTEAQLFSFIQKSSVGMKNFKRKTT